MVQVGMIAIWRCSPNRFFTLQNFSSSGNLQLHECLLKANICNNYYLMFFLQKERIVYKSLIIFVGPPNNYMGGPPNNQPPPPMGGPPMQQQPPWPQQPPPPTAYPGQWQGAYGGYPFQQQQQQQPPPQTAYPPPPWVSLFLVFYYLIDIQIFLKKNALSNQEVWTFLPHDSWLSCLISIIHLDIYRLVLSLP